MSFFLGLLTGGLLGAYWARPGGWLGGIHGYSPAYWYPGYAPYGYYPVSHQPQVAYYPSQAVYYPQNYQRGYWYW